MYLTLEFEGLNLEKLLREAPQDGITLRAIRRLGPRSVQANVPMWQLRKAEALCDRLGWSVSEVHAGAAMRLMRFVRKRHMLFAGMLICLIMTYVTDQMILDVRIENAQENTAEVRRFLAETGIRPGRFKDGFSLDNLRTRMALRLPGLSFSGVRYEGSTLIVDCHPARTGETVAIEGEGMDIVAAQPGIVTRIAVQSGTPQVQTGQAVRKGQVLIRGTERTEKGEMMAVQAQGQVYARVWAKGEARTSLVNRQTVETGNERRSVTLCTPWRRKKTAEAEDFASQDVSSSRQPVVGLYIPLWREIVTHAETIVHIMERNRSDAASWAQGAAEEIAKKQCPFDALILDKWVDYSMIDNEFVYATVVLEYEAPIAARCSDAK